MTKNDPRPIGVFDSGIGGLTVAHAIKELLPNETLIYFGDTAHLPYGDKSEAAVQAYSIKIADVLLNKDCKIIVIACNSASSAAYELLKEYVGRRAEIVNVIDPMIRYIRENWSSSRIGLIGTKRTVASGVYQKKVIDLDKGIELESVATPLLVPMIEEGFFNNRISTEIIARYLDEPQLQGIAAIILGCTHYPLIRKQIEEYYKGQVEVLDSSRITAQYLSVLLENRNLISSKKHREDQFLVSDYTESFEVSTRLFFTERVELVKYKLWE